MRADFVAAAVDSVPRQGRPLILLSPRGTPFTQSRARELARGPGAVLVCGRYEGIDERVIEARAMEEISMGDFVLSGGELAAMALIDACVRLLPGVIGDDQSLDEESFEDGLLEYPHYTRPPLWEGREIPSILMSGHHQRIRDWRRERAIEITKARRPDMWDAYLKRAPKTKH
jgi:tRNA (guanine37-N1)-methyltransferase